MSGDTKSASASTPYMVGKRENFSNHALYGRGNGGSLSNHRIYGQTKEERVTVMTSYNEKAYF